MKQTLQRYPWYVILLPAFFVLHGYVEYFSFLSLLDAAMLALRYIAFSLAVFLISWLIFRNIRKSGVITAAWMGFYLFFGALYDFLKMYSPVTFLWKYSFLLPTFMLLFFALFIYLWKINRTFLKLTFFLNCLFLVYIMIETGKGIWKSFHPEKQRRNFYTSLPVKQITIPATRKKPDIYFLLFDEYASSKSLRDRYGFKNDIDSFLTGQKFSVQSNSKSNYNYTPFSIASTLNMEYIPWLDAKDTVNRKMYLECNPLILENTLLGVLGTNGYHVENLSIFDLAGHPSRIKQSFLPVKTKMIAEATLFPRLYRDFTWYFQTNRWLSKLLENEDVFHHVNNNEYFLAELESISRKKTASPRFIYAHLFMPHTPFVYDANGNKQRIDTVRPYSPEAYLKYVQYTNTRMKKLVTTLKKHTNGEAVIIIMSDHGFRVPTDEKHPVWVFQNLNAVYFPGNDYSRLYDSITSVNQFRVVLNTLFDQQLSLLKDSTIYLLSPKETVEHGR
ncbi:MAG: sulfatase-like hydrolase/transferase [Chitinophagaceae bacterium]